MEEAQGKRKFRIYHGLSRVMSIITLLCGQAFKP